VVGITHHAKDQLGDVVYLELPEKGAQVKKGEAFGVVESTKAVSDLYAPVTGEIVAVNQGLLEAPEGINDDPHGKGWLIEIRIAAPAEVAELLDAAAYTALVG
jgi:glycine cleavage system H protein